MQKPTLRATQYTNLSAYIRDDVHGEINSTFLLLDKRYASKNEVIFQEYYATSNLLASAILSYRFEISHQEFSDLIFRQRIHSSNCIRTFFHEIGKSKNSSSNECNFCAIFHVTNISTRTSYFVST